MNNQKLNSIGLLAIFLVIAIPTVYGAVEPSIIINMESGQTEKPIQVKDSGGTIIFSVDTDGTVFPAPVIPTTVTTVQSLRHIVLGEESHTSTFTEDVDDQIILAKWRVDFNSPLDDNGGFFGLPPVFVTHFVLSGFMKNDNADFVQTSMSTSFDDVTIDDEFQTDGNGSVAFQVTKFDDVNDFDICQRDNIAEDECFITFGFHIPQGSGSTGVIADYLFELGIILPADTTITQVFP